MKSVNVFKKQNFDERLNIDDLLQFINDNKNVIDNLGCIDINDIKKDIKKELIKLNFRDVRTVNYLPHKLNEIFNVEDNKYLHAGVLDNLPTYNGNISLYSSILICVAPSFLSKTVEHQRTILENFINCCKSNSKNFNYSKFGWDRDDIYNCLCKGFIGTNIIKFLCDFMCINIFVLDLESEKLTFGGGDVYNKYKKNIFLIRYSDDHFEPFYADHSRFFSLMSDIMKKIHQNISNIDVYPLYSNMSNTLNEKEEDLDHYLHIKKKDEEKEEKDKKDKKDKEEKENKYTLKDLKPLKLNELQQIAEAFSIDLKVNDKKKTKDQLINAILKEN